MVNSRWAAGDTINTASRMESTSFAMSVQLSEAAVLDANTPDDFCPLGKRSIKGKGIMSTYLLKVQTSPARASPKDLLLPGSCAA